MKLDELSQNFSINLRVLRTQQNLSQLVLAQRAELSVAYVSLLERGKRSPPLPTVVQVAKALRVKPVYLLQELDLPKGVRDLRKRPRAARSGAR
jgi:transcriptional regulator with XRE-family HTH domain